MSQWKRTALAVRWIVIIVFFIHLMLASYAPQRNDNPSSEINAPKLVSAEHRGSISPSTAAPKTCTLPDLPQSKKHWSGLYASRERWSGDWVFVHTHKTMGTTIRAQLPRDYNRMIPGMVSIRAYERANGVKLRTRPDYPDSIYSEGEKRMHFDHINLDFLVDLGILRCSDIERLDLIAVIREPTEWFVSHANHFQRSCEENLSCLEERTCYGRQAEQLWFEYDWNVTLFTMENSKEISGWFRKHGVAVTFDEGKKGSWFYSKRHRMKAPRRKTCLAGDITANQRQRIQSVLAPEMMLYDAARKNNGVIEIGHHAFDAGNQGIKATGQQKYEIGFGPAQTRPDSP